MSWVANLCGCLPLHDTIINYLNSSHLSNQVIEEEKCTQQTNPESIYIQAKTKSFNFMQVQEDSDDDEAAKQPSEKYYQREGQSEDEADDSVIDVFWYPACVGNKWEHYRNLLKNKSNLLGHALCQSPSSSNYDKIYDSQDQLELGIYCRLESMPKGKRINSFRFCFRINDAKMETYQEWLNSKKQGRQNIESLLLKEKLIEQDPEDNELTITHRIYKKLLVINPHDFLIASKTQKIEDQDMGISYITTLFSVKQTEVEEKASNSSRGWIHLAGLKVNQDSEGLFIEGYLNMQLQASISPSMLKQPVAKEIRVLVQRLVCAIRQTDEI